MLASDHPCPPVRFDDLGLTRGYRSGNFTVVYPYLSYWAVLYQFSIVVGVGVAALLFRKPAPALRNNVAGVITKDNLHQRAFLHAPLSKNRH